MLLHFLIFFHFFDIYFDIFLTDLHFDAEHVLEGQRRLYNRNSQINIVTTVDQNYAAARGLLGQSLHSIQVRIFKTGVVIKNLID